jgi:peptidyl-prolyl cis-trans isomerase SurA
MSVRLLRSLLLVVLAFAAGPGQAADQRIAAVVNDDVISMQDLNERLELVLLTSRIPDSGQARARLEQQVLRGLIEETLQLQEARRLALDVTAEETTRAMASIAQRNQMDVEQMTRFLEDNGINLATLQDQLRAQIAWLKVVGREISPKVTVSADQVDIAVQEASLNQGQPEYLLSEIVLPVDSPAQEQVVVQDARRLVQTLAEGASFESLASQVSAAATAANGGDLGWIRAAAIPGELVATLERLRPGDVSEPVRSAVGYHLFKLRERRLAQPATDVAAEVQLTQILFPVDGASQDGRTALREKAAGLRGRLTDCPAMVAVADELQAPASGDLGWLKLGELPAELGGAVAKLAVGQVSEPLDGPGGIHLLMVCARRDQGQDQAAAPDRQKIQERLQREAIERMARRYLRDLRKDAFVDVRL